MKVVFPICNHISTLQFDPIILFNKSLGNIILFHLTQYCYERKHSANALLRVYFLRTALCTKELYRSEKSSTVQWCTPAGDLIDSYSKQFDYLPLLLFPQIEVSKHAVNSHRNAR